MFTKPNENIEISANKTKNNNNICATILDNRIDTAFSRYSIIAKIQIELSRIGVQQMRRHAYRVALSNLRGDLTQFEQSPRMLQEILLALSFHVEN